MKTQLYNTAHPLAESGKPIFIPFGEWNYDGQSRQRLDRAHGEKIANELNARVAKGDPGIPVYQGHPDVPALAAKYPDKGALGWVVKIEIVNECCQCGNVANTNSNSQLGNGNIGNGNTGNIKPGLALTVEWDRDPGRGFRWFSPYWLANSREGGTYIVDEIASIGLVNNPNIPEFRLANEAEDTTLKGENMELDIEELKKLLGLPPEAEAKDLMDAIRAAAAAKQERDIAIEKEHQAEAARDLEKADKEKLEVELENEKKAHKATADALANEKAVRADAAIDAAVRERRIGESARETWKTRLVNEGAPAYAALANEKPLPTRDASKGLANECGDQTDSEKRKAMVNEIMAKENVDYDTAWARAVRRSPELFK